jgi:hypothetical protein
LLHVTIAGNGTGIGGDGTSSGGARGVGGGIALTNGSGSVANSIIASNDPNQCGGSVGATDGGHDFSFPDGTCPGAVADPLLAALADNGGATKTMALAASSPAVDAVPSTGANCAATDQRGTTRPQGSACDAGAYELVPTPTTTTSTTNNQQSGGSTQTQTTPTPTPAAHDTTPPAVKLLLTKQKLLKALKKGYFAFFSDNEIGSATAELDASGKDARGTALRKPKRVAYGTLKVTKTGKQKLVLKFTKKAKRAFAKRKKVTLKLTLVVKDAAGNATKKGATVVLKR